MNKVKKKRYDSTRAVAIKWTAEKYGVSREYVRAAIYGTANGGRTEEILRTYRAKYRELEEALSI